MEGELLAEQQRAITTAATALSRARGEVITLTAVKSLSNSERRNLILRAAVKNAGGTFESIIIKATRDKTYDPNGIDAFERSGLVKEWAATAFLTEHAPHGRHAPVFLAGDVGIGLLVLQDLGADLDSLVRPLLEGSAVQAEEALLAYASSFGRLHVGTLDAMNRHGEVLRRSFPAAKPLPPAGGARWQREVVAKVFDLLGGPLPEVEVSAVASRMIAPGAWLGLAHRDGCPDNVLFAEGKANLLDFEFAGPGHVLLDAAYWRMGFPTCWCAGRVPEAVIAAMDRAYRKALAASLPAVLDDAVFISEMAFLLFARLFASLSWLLPDALKEESRWGIAGKRARLLWHLEATITGASAANTLGGLSETAARWRAELGSQWQGTKPLPLYPAFAS